jgi:ABC-type sulfate transport system permease component
MMRAPRTFPPLLSVIAGLVASLLLVFLAAPIIELVGAGGGEGLRRLGSDAELRGALALTAFCATAATVIGVLLSLIHI